MLYVEEAWLRDGITCLLQGEARTLAALIRHSGGSRIRQSHCPCMEKRWALQTL